MQTTDNASQQLNELVALFKSPDKLKRGLTETFINMAGRPCDSYSVGNKMLLFSAGTHDARGYRQWQAVGRQVKAGTKAVYILAPLVGKKTETTKAGEEKEITYVYGFRTIPLYKIEDTEIVDPAIWEKSSSFKPRNIPPLMDIAKKLNIEIMYDNTYSGELGSCTPDGKTIRLCTESEITFYHELGHAVHAKIEGKLKGGQTLEQEIVAELFAGVMARLYGINYEGYTFDYIASYCKTTDPVIVGRECMKVAATVEKCLNFVFDIQKPKYQART